MGNKKKTKLRKSVTILFFIIVLTVAFMSAMFIGGEYLQKRTAYLNEHSISALKHKNLPFLYTRDSIIYRVVPFLYDEKKLAESGMPVYELKVKDKYLDILKKECDRVLVEATILGDAEGVVSKEYYPAEALVNGEWTGIEIKLRGRWENHFRREHPSLRLKYPEEKMPDGIQQINLSAPMDKRPISDLTINEEMKNMGFLTLRNRFAVEKMNGKVVGVFQEIEQPGKSLADRSGRVEGYIFGGDGQPFIEDDSEKFIRAERAVKILTDYLYKNRGTPEQVLQVIDADKFAKAAAVTALLNSNHAWVADNLRLFYDHARGRLEPIPWDYMVFDMNGDHKKPNPRILEIPYVNCLYEKELRNLIENRVDDIVEMGGEVAGQYIRQLESSRHTGFAGFLLKFDYFNKIAMSRSEWNEASIRMDYQVFRTTLKVNAQELRGSIKSVSDAACEMDIVDNKQLSDLPAGIALNGNKLVFGPGEVVLEKSLETPYGYSVVFTPGLNLKIGADAKLVINGDFESQGTPQRKIVVEGINGKNFGSVAAYGTASKRIKVNMSNTVFDGGSGGLNEKQVFNSGLLIVDADVFFDSVEIRNGFAEDGVNIVYSNVNIVNSVFENNSGDGLDMDFCDGVLSGNEFINTGGDAIDISGSRLRISGDKVMTCGDKGVSAGEGSEPYISDMSIEGCAIGVASKDGSIVVARGMEISGVDTGLAVYRKKLTFGIPEMNADGVIMRDVQNAVFKGKDAVFRADASYRIDGAKKTDINQIVNNQ